ncbi:DUF2563 family protein [Streptomyces sp. NPDC060031]|uniref:DUF2563 family protein n=1 Tax=Streptomyces sp. NPDC060031 TaxID=3347043 RepID=UPI0036A1E563
MALDRRADLRALEIDFNSLTHYKATVDGLLLKLGESAASDEELARFALPSGALGTGFAEADALFTAYHTVQEHLRDLSRALAGQIEALGIAILSADKGFTAMDDEAKRRMAALAKRARQDYAEDRDPPARGSTAGGRF